MTLNVFGLRVVPPAEYRLLTADAGTAREAFAFAEEWKATADQAQVDYHDARAEIARTALIAENNRQAADLLAGENRSLRAALDRLRAIADATGFARRYLGPDVGDVTAAMLVDAALDAQSVTIRRLRAQHAEADTMHRQEVAALHTELHTVRGKHQRATALIGRLVRQRDRMIDGARLVCSWSHVQT